MWSRRQSAYWWLSPRPSGSQNTQSTNGRHFGMAGWAGKWPAAMPSTTPRHGVHHRSVDLGGDGVADGVELPPRGDEPIHAFTGCVGSIEDAASRRRIEAELEVGAARGRVVGGDALVAAGGARLVVDDDEPAVVGLVDSVDRPAHGEESAVGQLELDRRIG